jgi:cell division protein FtsW
MDGIATTTPLEARGRFTLSAGILLLSVVCLTLIGLVVLFSASQSIYNNEFTILKKQLVWLVIALASGITVYLVSLEKMQKAVWVLSGLVILGLILTLIPGIGITVNGAQRWIGFGGLRVQVSEFSKPILVLALATYLAQNQRIIGQFMKGFFIPMIMIGFVCALILKQPDFGTAALCGMVGFTMVFLAGSRFIFVIPAILLAVGLFSIMVYNDPVRLARVTSFLHIQENISTGAYQLWQGILAFGAGGYLGVGLGNGRQQFSFLPEAHTDFIFAILGEELGLVATLTVVLLFLAIFLVGMFQLRRAPNLFQFLLGIGSLLFIVLQAVINIGVVTGSFPTKGMSLPFISYGGSNLVVVFVFTGILLNLFRQWEKPIVSKARELEAL